MASNIATIESFILTKLRAVITDRPVEASPEDPQQYKDLPIGENGIVLVSYRGSAFSELLEQGDPPSGQARSVQFDVTMIVRDLRSHTGAYTIIEAVRAALTGQEVCVNAPLRCIRDGFHSVVNHLWFFSSTFEAVILDESAA